MAELRLTEWTACGGCAAKWGAAPLTALVRELAGSTPDGLLVGLAPFDDAAVWRVSDDVALVSTTDFFPPLVDDPDDFGAIAAANACSDVFAMGGRVVLALNVAAFPESLPEEAVAAILAAAAAVVVEAGGVVAGGHTIRSPEPIFGLAVQGVVHPDRVLTKGGARPGDILLLSKPLGTGILLAGGSAAEKAEAITRMRELNRRASEALVDLGPGVVHACTDVTGFGLAGHGWEVAERSGARLVFAAGSLPLYRGAARRRRVRRSAPAGTPATGPTSSIGSSSEPGSARRSTPSSTIRRPPGACSPPSIPPSPTISPAGVGFVEVGFVEAGAPLVELR